MLRIAVPNKGMLSEPAWNMLAEAGWEEFPKTMDELIQCIDDCTKVGADGSIEQMGLIPDYPWLDNVLWPVAFGAQFIDEETNTITFDSQGLSVPGRHLQQVRL